MAELPPAAEILRAHDRERFQTSLFARPPARDALIALHAFDCEIGRVRHLVSQPMPGLIRLQWWRDALDGIAEDRPLEHPVVQAMHAAWARLAAHRPALDAAIDAREVELHPVPLATVSDLEDHLERIAGGIGRAAAAVLGEDRAEAAAGRVFRAWAIVRLLSEIEADRRQGRTMLPARLLQDHGLGLAGLDAGRHAEAMRPPVRQMVAMAEALLRAARAEIPKPHDALPALLLATPASSALRHLARSDYDYRSAWFRRRPLGPLHLAWQSARRRY